MKLLVIVKPNSSEESVEKTGPSEFVVRIKEVAEKGRANQALRRALAKYFSVSQSQISIIVGHKTRRKIISLTKNP